MSNQTASLLVDGKLYNGWKAIDITASIETISGDFTLGYFDSWGGQSVRWPIMDGDACEVRLGDDTVLTGYVDETDDSLAADNSSFSVTGRDKTADLVDCSAIHKPDQWSGLTLDAIAAIVCSPFGVEVTSQADCGAAFPTIKVQPGESAFALLERLCRMRGVLPVADGKGGLVLTQAGKGGTASSALVEGDNILSIGIQRSSKERFSEYVVKGQQSGLAALPPGDVEVLSTDGEVTQRAAAPASGKAKDEGIARYRPLLIVSEGEASGASPATRAVWEAIVRAGRGLRVEVSVQGWRQADATLWRPNFFVQVRYPSRSIDDTLLIVSCNYRLDEGGTVTTLSLARQDAFMQLPPAKTKRASGLPDALPPGTEVLKA